MAAGVIRYIGKVLAGEVVNLDETCRRLGYDPYGIRLMVERGILHPLNSRGDRFDSMEVERLAREHERRIRLLSEMEETSALLREYEEKYGDEDLS